MSEIDDLINEFDPLRDAAPYIRAPRPRGKREDLTGQKFSYLTAIKFAHKKNGHTFWEWLCDCGNTKIAPAHQVKYGEIMSCGCARRRLGEVQPFPPTKRQLRIPLLKSRAWRGRFMRLLQKASDADRQWAKRLLMTRQDSEP